MASLCSRGEGARFSEGAISSCSTPPGDFPSHAIADPQKAAGPPNFISSAIRRTPPPRTATMACIGDSLNRVPGPQRTGTRSSAQERTQRQIPGKAVLSRLRTPWAPSPSVASIERRRRRDGATLHRADSRVGIECGEDLRPGLDGNRLHLRPPVSRSAVALSCATIPAFAARTLSEADWQ